MTQDNPQHDELPETLITALRAAEPPVPEITGAVDREIARLAEHQFRNRRRRRVIRYSSVAAIAASVLVGLFIIQTQDPALESTASLYADLDQSGQIDIADVLLAARARQGDPAQQAALDAFAMQVVALDSTGGRR